MAWQTLDVLQSPLTPAGLLAALLCLFWMLVRGNEKRESKLSAEVSALQKELREVYEARLEESQKNTEVIIQLNDRYHEDLKQKNLRRL